MTNMPSPPASAQPGDDVPPAVVIVGPLPPPSGGMANQTLEVARCLGMDGARVTLVQTNAPYKPSWIGAVPVLRAMARLVPYLIRLWSDVRRGDVVHVMANSGWAWHLFAAPAIWIAHLRGVPCVVTYHGGEAEAFFARSFRVVRPTLSRAARVIVPSAFLAGVFERFCIRTLEIPNVVDFHAFFPADAPPTSPRIVVTRNLEEVYDNATALRAFAQVRARFPALRITVAGSGPQRGALERLACELGVADHVHFTGRVDGRDVPPLYRAATMAVNPSRADNLPVSLLEAMASGIPIVSTNVGGIPHLLRDGENAILVPPGEPALMADAIARLLTDPTLVQRLVARARDDVAAYSWVRVRPLLMAAYRAVASGRTIPAGGRGQMPTDRVREERS